MKQKSQLLTQTFKTGNRNLRELKTRFNLCHNRGRICLNRLKICSGLKTKNQKSIKKKSRLFKTKLNLNDKLTTKKSKMQNSKFSRDCSKSCRIRLKRMLEMIQFKLNESNSLKKKSASLKLT